MIEIFNIVFAILLGIGLILNSFAKLGVALASLVYIIPLAIMHLWIKISIKDFLKGYFKITLIFIAIVFCVGLMSYIAMGGVKMDIHIDMYRETE